MSPLNRGPLMGPRMPPVGLRPPPPRFGRPPMPGMPPRMPGVMPLPPMPIEPYGAPYGGPVRQRMFPPRAMMRPGGGPQPLFGPGPRNRGPMPLMMGPMIGPRMPPHCPPMRPGPRGMLSPPGPPHMRPRFPPTNGNAKGKHINNSKKTSKFEELELKKPWMTDEIRSEIQKKNKLYAKAKKNKDAKEWDEFKDLRNKVTRMIRDAKNEYFTKNPDQATLYEDEADYYDNRDENYESEEEENISYYCEPCDRDFLTAELLDKHLKEHRVCGIDDCKFSAHAKIVDKHVLMQHKTGLYDRMKNAAQSPEEYIAKRKSNYPTKSQIELKNEIKLEKRKRGEVIEKTNNKKSFKEKKTRRAKKRRLNVQEPEYEQNKKVDEMYRGIFPFRGTRLLQSECKKKTSLDDDDDENEENQTPDDKISDEEDDRVSAVNIEPTLKDEESKPMNETLSDDVTSKGTRPVNALSSLGAAYGSDTDDDNEPPDEISSKKIKLDGTESNENIFTNVQQPDGESPDKKIPPTPIVEIPSNNNLSTGESLDNQTPSTSGKTIPTKTPNKNKQPNSMNEKNRNTKENKNSKKNLGFLTALLSSDIQHERNYISQCIQFIFENSYFDQNISSD